MHCRT